MKVIYFGVSIFALVVSATSHAMEDDQTTPPCQSHQQSSQMSHPSLQWWGWVPDHSQTFHFEKEAKEDTNPLMGEIELTDKKDMDQDKKRIHHPKRVQLILMIQRIWVSLKKRISNTWWV